MPALSIARGPPRVARGFSLTFVARNPDQRPSASESPMQADDRTARAAHLDLLDELDRG